MIHDLSHPTLSIRILTSPISRASAICDRIDGVLNGQRLKADFEPQRSQRQRHGYLVVSTYLVQAIAQDGNQRGQQQDIRQYDEAQHELEDD